jgi:hypothetical protein
VIRNAVIHMVGDQPLVADLFELPAAVHVGLLCTNLRTLTGTRPVFADRIESVFFFPYSHIRFVEIPPGSQVAAEGATGESAATDRAPDVEPEAAEPEPELELDEDFLRRVREV